VTMIYHVSTVETLPNTQKACFHWLGIIAPSPKYDRNKKLSARIAGPQGPQ
jgi:hypothetical protein